MPREPSFNTPAWRTAIIEYIARHPDKLLKQRALARELGVPDHQYAPFRALVREMLDSGALVLARGRTLALPKAPPAPSSNIFTGVFRAHPRGFGFIESPDRPDAYVPPQRTANALDGDIVEARLLRPRPHAPGLSAEITRVIEHAETHWVGILERQRDRWLVRPIGKAPAPVVIIEDPTAKSARPGDMVAVEPIDTKLNPHSVRGVIIERLGKPGRSQTKVRAVAASYGLPRRFAGAVRNAARRAAAKLDQAALADREDLRDWLTITIDPPDARDFDDAITIRKRPGGLVELGVHIADVAHFVQPGSALDREAKQRGNSTYLPGYVIPMLPETLSNGVCSLQPEQVRLTKSAMITYDQQAHVVETRFCNSVIRSDVRLTYDQVTQVLAGKTLGLKPAVVRLIRAADELAKRIRNRRRRAGMISLSLPEVELVLDDQGDIRDARPADTSFSHTIIEMFMVEANEAVCTLFAQLNVPHMRRIHPDPDPDAVERLSKALAGMGIRAPRTLDHRAIQNLLDRVAKRPERPAVNMLLLRSLAQATYGPALLGHFALASRHYTHFTSPIRRYPDLIVHRLFDHLLRRRGKPIDVSDPDIPDDATLAELGAHTSATERRSQQAERDAKQWLLVELLAGKVGEAYEGLITGIVSSGVFVQIEPYLAEGFIATSDFGDDAWKYDGDAMCFTGRRSGRVIAFGQKVRIRIAAVDEFARQVVFVPENPETLGVRRKRAAGDGAKRAKTVEHPGRTRAQKRIARKSGRPARSGARRRRR